VIQSRISKGKGMDMAVCGGASPLLEIYMPYSITQCYLPPSSGDIPAFTPTEAGTRFSDPRWMQGLVDLVMVLFPKIVYPQKTVTYLRNNWAVLWLGLKVQMRCPGHQATLYF